MVPDTFFAFSTRTLLRTLTVLLFLSPWSIPQAVANDPLGPSGLCATRDGKRLLVACADTPQLRIVNPVRGTTEFAVSLPSAATGLAIDQTEQTAYVTCAGPVGLLAKVDIATGALQATIPVGHTPMSPIVASESDRVYVCNRFDNDVTILDRLTGRTEACVPVVRQPVAAALTADERLLVVANHLPLGPANALLVQAAVTLIDTATLRTYDILLPDGASSLREVTISPDDRYAVITHVLSNFDLVASHVEEGWINTNAISVVDLRQRRLLGHTLLDDQYQGAANPWGVGYSEDSSRIYIAHAGSHELTMVRAEALYNRLYRNSGQRGPMGMPNWLGADRQRIKLFGNGPRALAVRGTNVYVAEYFSDSIAHIDFTRPDIPYVHEIVLQEDVTQTLVRQGEQAFHDGRLCYQHWQSCASCHPDGRSDGLNWDLLNDGAGNRRSTKSLLLAHQTPPAMITGVRATAEIAVRSGLHHILYSDAGEEVAQAIDAYLQSLKPVVSPYRNGTTLSERAQRGELLFRSAEVGCVRCHPAPWFTDRKLHAVSTEDIHGQRLFDTPTLVEVWRTAPYLHDGRYTNMLQLLREGHHGLSAKVIKDLTDEQLRDLTEYVLSL